MEYLRLLTKDPGVWVVVVLDGDAISTAVLRSNDEGDVEIVHESGPWTEKERSEIVSECVACARALLWTGDVKDEDLPF